MTTKTIEKNIMNLSEREVAEIVEDRPRVIGGYISIDSRMSPLMPCNNGWLVNSGPNALEFILKSLPEVKAVLIPEYYNPEIEKKLESMKIKVRRYSVAQNFEMTEEPVVGEGEYIILVNYFGVKDHYVYEKAIKYGDKAIVDNSHAWYASLPCGTKAFFSAPEFFGVPDGGKAVGASLDGALWESLDRSVSYDRCEAMLKRIDCGAEEAEDVSRMVEKKVSEEKLMKISHLTDSMLRNVAFTEIRQKRLSNFQHLHSVLGTHNKLAGIMDPSMKAPKVYPFLCNDANLKKYLIDNKIYCSTGMTGKIATPESENTGAAENIIAFPIDQRYDFNDMEYILDLIRNYGKDDEE